MKKAIPSALWMRFWKYYTATKKVPTLTLLKDSTYTQNPEPTTTWMTNKPSFRILSLMSSSRPAVHKPVPPLQQLGLKTTFGISTGCGRKKSPIWEANKFKTKEDTANVFYFWKVHRMPFYINVFWTKHHSSSGLEYWYTDVASLGSCPWPWESFQV